MRWWWNSYAEPAEQGAAACSLAPLKGLYSQLTRGLAACCWDMLNQHWLLGVCVRYCVANAPRWIAVLLQAVI
jgi:hypothetical protein